MGRSCAGLDKVGDGWGGRVQSLQMHERRPRIRSTPHTLFGSACDMCWLADHAPCARLQPTQHAHAGTTRAMLHAPANETCQLAEYTTSGMCCHQTMCHVLAVRPRTMCLQAEQAPCSICGRQAEQAPCSMLHAPCSMRHAPCAICHAICASWQSMSTLPRAISQSMHPTRHTSLPTAPKPHLEGTALGHEQLRAGFLL
eukprot:351852-Chlamydomonas_euryale.AAC.5